MRRTAVVLVLVVSCVSHLAATGAAEGAGAAPARAEIAYIEGDVRLGEEEAGIGDVVESGSTIETGTDGVCEIVIGEQNIIRVLENTVAVIDLDPQHPVVDLQSGAAAAVLNKLQVISRRKPLSVATPNTVAGVRGTVFFVKIEDDGSTYVCACYGTLRLNEGLRARRFRVSSSHHAAYRFRRDANGEVSASTAGLLYHDDAFMEAVAEKIGFRIPWGNGGYSAEGGGY